MEQRSLKVRVLAFLGRALARSRGAYVTPCYGVNVEPRAARFLTALAWPPESLTFQIALENLLEEFDLLDEECAMMPKALELQARVIELADGHEAARSLTGRMLNEPPVARLFSAILGQASEGAARGVRMEFRPESVDVLFQPLDGLDWHEAMRIPVALSKQVKGIADRAVRVGYASMRRHLIAPQPLPEHVTFRWESDDRFEMELS